MAEVHTARGGAGGGITMQAMAMQMVNVDTVLDTQVVQLIEKLVGLCSKVKKNHFKSKDIFQI